jgi:hypothetical protein
MLSALDYLLKHEWSMGNGQCPDCGGVPESWFPHPCHPTADTLGHKEDCPLAASIKELGGVPLYLGASKLEGEYMFAYPLEGGGNKCFRMVPKGTPGYETMWGLVGKGTAEKLAQAVEDDLMATYPHLKAILDSKC